MARNLGEMLEEIMEETKSERIKMGNAVARNAEFVKDRQRQTHQGKYSRPPTRDRCHGRADFMGKIFDDAFDLIQLLSDDVLKFDFHLTSRLMTTWMERWL